MSIRYLGGSEHLDIVFTKNKLYTIFTEGEVFFEVSCDFDVVYDLEVNDYKVYFTKDLYVKNNEEVIAMNKKQLRNEEIKKACDDLAELLIKKNNDYGDSFSQQYDKYGLVSALIRMDDKMRRLENLNKVGSAEVNESIADTLLDLSGYSLLACVEAMRKSE